MAHFSGTYVQNFDQKGRVSVPAPFRVALRAGCERLSTASDGPVAIPLVLRPSEKAACIEGWTESGFNGLLAELEKLDQLSAEYDALATVLYGDAYPMETDKEGRIIVPDALLAGAGISRGENVAFLGLGSRFQLWEPEAVAAQKAAALAVNAARLALRKAAVP